MEVHDNGGSPSQSLSELQIVTIISVSPQKMSEPRAVRRVLVSEDNTRAIHGCYQIVLYYENLKEEDHGWCLAGWIVESLARVLLDHPLLAGRLQRREDTGFEIVANDSGIRLLEACYPTTLSHFLGSYEKEQHLEAELVFWKEIDDHFPQFSPLFYVQVTNFECGGYSIGISCSLLLAEALLVENFIGKWAEIHNKMSPQHGEIKTPIFNNPRLKNPDSLPPDIISRTEGQNRVQSMVFKITTQDAYSWRELAMLCVEEAEQKLGTSLGSEFFLVVKESSEVIRVESCSMNGWSMQGMSLKHEISRSTWEEFGVYEVGFYEGNKPVHVSCWFHSVGDGHAMAIPLKDNAYALFLVSSPLSSSQLF